MSRKIVPKRKKDISTIDRKIISMYARGLSTRQISDTIEEIYGFEVSDSFISDVTDKIYHRFTNGRHVRLTRFIRSFLSTLRIIQFAKMGL